MFLGEVYGASVRLSQVIVKTANEEESQVVIAAHMIFDNGHGQEANLCVLYGSARCNIVFVGKVGTVAQVLPRTHHANALVAVAIAFLYTFTLPLSKNIRCVGFSPSLYITSFLRKF